MKLSCDEGNSLIVNHQWARVLCCWHVVAGLPRTPIGTCPLAAHTRGNLHVLGTAPHWRSKPGCDGAVDVGAAHGTEGPRCHDALGAALAGTLQRCHR